MTEANEKLQDTLRPIKTAESILLPIPRETFEKLYLSPKHPWTASDLRKKVGNPTPIALMGFLIAATPNACIMMGWRGAGGDGGAIIPVYLFFGGFVQLLGSVGEWLIGNTFSSVVFFTYGAFWIVQGSNLVPWFATGLHYSETGNSLQGMQTEGYNASIGFYYVALTIISFIFLICSIRTNVCLLLALALLVIAFGLFGGSYFQLALGEAALAEKLQHIGGAFALALCMPIWYILTAQLLEAVDFPIVLPVGDLSTIVLGRSQKTREHEE